MSYDEKGLFRISYSYILLLLPPQLQKMTHIHKIIVLVKCSSRMEPTKSLLILGRNGNYVFKIIMQSYLRVEPMNDQIQRTLLPDTVNKCYQVDNLFIHMLNILHLQVCVTVLRKISNLPKWSCVLNCLSEYTGIYVPDAEINNNKVMDLPFICFCHYENVGSFYLHMQLLTEHVNNSPICTNIENTKKGKVHTTISISIYPILYARYHFMVTKSCKSFLSTIYYQTSH